MPKPGKKSPTVGDKFQTEQTAITIFRQLLPAKWISREQLPDFHLDYLVEIVDAGELTGLHLGVQLKGWRRKKNHKGPPKYKLKTKHLAYYADKCTHPVFLVLVDVSNNAAYWVFMQKFGREHDLHWRNQQKVTVEFDNKNTLSNHAAFVVAVREAVKYTRDLHPGSVKAALQGAQQALEAQDLRIAAKIDVVDGVQKITLHPKEDFPFTIKFKTDNPETVQNIKNFIEKGDDLKIKHSEIQFVGAPILGSAFQGEGELTIHHRQERAGHVLLSWNESDVLSHLHIPGRFWAGTKYISCEAAVPDAPVHVSATIDPASWNQQRPVNINFAIRPNAWEGQPLMALAHFEQVHALVKGLLGGGQVCLRFYVQGNILGTAHMDKSNLSEMSGFLDLLEILKKARRLSEHFKVNVDLPPANKIADEDYNSVDELFAVVFEGGHRMRIPPSTKFWANTDRPINPNELHNFAIVTRDQKYPFFGATINVEHIETRLTRLKIAPQEPPAGSNGVRLSLEATNDSERFVRLPQSDTPS